jgi:hypothetical protein
LPTWKSIDASCIPIGCFITLRNCFKTPHWLLAYIFPPYASAIFSPIAMAIDSKMSLAYDENLHASTTAGVLKQFLRKFLTIKTSTAQLSQCSKQYCGR